MNLPRTTPHLPIPGDEPELLQTQGLIFNDSPREPAGLGAGRAAEQSAQRGEVRAAVLAAQRAADGPTPEAVEDPWTIWMLSLPDDALLDIYKAKEGGGYVGSRLERVPVSQARALGMEIWPAAERWLAERVRSGNLYVSPRNHLGERLPGFQSRLVAVRNMAGVISHQVGRPASIEDDERAAVARREAAEIEERAARLRLAELDKQAEIEAAREERADKRRREEEERRHAAAVELKRMELESAEKSAARQQSADQQKLLLDLALGRGNQQPAPQDPMLFLQPMMQAQQTMMIKNIEMISDMYSRRAEALEPQKPDRVERLIEAAVELGGPLVQGLKWRLGQPVSTPAPAPVAVPVAQVQANPGPVVSASEATAETIPAATAEATRAAPTVVSPAERRQQFLARQRHYAVGLAIEHLMAVQAGVIADDDDGLDGFLDVCPADVAELIGKGDMPGIIAAVGPVVEAEPNLSQWFGTPGVQAWVMEYLGRVRDALGTDGSAPST